MQDQDEGDDHAERENGADDKPSVGGVGGRDGMMRFVHGALCEYETQSHVNITIEILSHKVTYNGH